MKEQQTISKKNWEQKESERKEEQLKEAVSASKYLLKHMESSPCSR